MNTDTVTTWATYVVWDEWRGQPNKGAGSRPNRNCFNKDFAIAYDRLICLKDGQYKLEADVHVTGTGDQYSIWYVNGSYAGAAFREEGVAGGLVMSPKATVHLKRGDYVQMRGEYGGLDTDDNQATITRLN